MILIFERPANGLGMADLVIALEFFNTLKLSLEIAFACETKINFSNLESQLGLDNVSQNTLKLSVKLDSDK